jgi:hypothetical protein
MQTTVGFSDALYREGVDLAASRGATVEQFIIDAVARAVQGDPRSSASNRGCNREVELPLIHSKRPGTLDLSISTLMNYFTGLSLWIPWSRANTFITR